VSKLAKLHVDAVKPLPVPVTLYQREGHSLVHKKESEHMGLFFGDGAPAVLPLTVVPKVGATLGEELGEELGAEEVVGAGLGSGVELGWGEELGSGEEVGANVGDLGKLPRSRTHALSNAKSPSSSSGGGILLLLALLSPERSLGSLRRRETALAASTCPGVASPLFRCARMSLARSTLLSSAFTVFGSYESTSSNFTTMRNLRLGR
jgi:hypothetical protein